LQEKSHSVQRLPVHLENEQIIFFEENDNIEKITTKISKKNKLMAYFEYLNKNSNQNYLYVEMPKYCT
jgi:hypothetical protein